MDRADPFCFVPTYCGVCVTSGKSDSLKPAVWALPRDIGSLCPLRDQGTPVPLLFCEDPAPPVWGRVGRSPKMQLPTMTRGVFLGAPGSTVPAGSDLPDTAASQGVPPTVKSSCFILCLSLIVSHLQVQIVYKPVDLSKVTSKCGSLGNIHHKPGSPYRRREGRGWGQDRLGGAFS